VRKSILLFSLLCTFSTQPLLAEGNSDLSNIFSKNSKNNQVDHLSSLEMKSTQGANLTSVTNTQFATSLAQSSGFISTSIALASSNGVSLALNMPVNITISPSVNRGR
jgi:hypothetical protein